MLKTQKFFQKTKKNATQEMNFEKKSENMSGGQSSEKAG